MKYHLLLSALLVLSACSSKQETEKSYTLQPTEQYLEYEIDEETRVPLYHLYTFETDGMEYLTFPNRETRTLLVNPWRYALGFPQRAPSTAALSTSASGLIGNGKQGSWGKNGSEQNCLGQFISHLRKANFQVIQRLSYTHSLNCSLI